MCCMMSSRYSSQASLESSLAIISCLFRASILAASRIVWRWLGSSDSTKKVLSVEQPEDAILTDRAVESPRRSDRGAVLARRDSEMSGGYSEISSSSGIQVRYYGSSSQGPRRRPSPMTSIKILRRAWRIILYEMRDCGWKIGRAEAEKKKNRVSCRVGERRMSGRGERVR